MTRDEALKILGCDSDESLLIIEENYATGRRNLIESADKARTTEMKDAYSQALALYDDAFMLLVSGKASAEVLDGPEPNATYAQQNVSLSDTKLADLPGAAPSFTQMSSGGMAAAPSLALHAGTVLNERYEIVRLIGQGGMGAVYEAHDRMKDESIAIKVLLPGLVSSEQAKERFLAEAKISCKLSQRNIINVFDVQQSGPHHFLTMELLVGQTLREKIEVQKVARSEFSVDEVKDIATQVGQALSYAHSHMVHRDLKPENIFLCEDGTVKVMDFGIVRLLTSTELTKTGMALGTAYYMAPEQLTGAKSVDARADQYSLGVILYELLSGQLPMGAVAPIGQIRTDITKSMAQAIMKAISPKPEDRFPALDAFIGALDNKSAMPSMSNIGTGGGASMTKYIGIAAAIIVSIGGTYAFMQTDTWESIRPLSSPEKQAIRAEALQLQSELEGYLERIDDEQREMQRQLRDADNDMYLADVYDALEQLVFKSPHLIKVKADQRVADALVREKDYRAAISKLESPHQTAQKLLALRDVASNTYDLEVQNNKAVADWLEFERRNKLAEPIDSNLLQPIHDPQRDLAHILPSEAMSLLVAHGESLSRNREIYGAHLADQMLAVAQRIEDARREAGIKRKAADAARAEEARVITRTEAARLKAARAEASARTTSTQQSIDTCTRSMAASRRPYCQDSMTEGTAGPPLVVAPTGSFQFGSNLTDTALPPREKIISAPIGVSKYEVTIGEYREYCMATGRRCPEQPNNSPDFPVVNVSWNDAVDYCSWLSAETRFVYRLPTEEEWEFLARAGTRSPYFFGDEITPSAARSSHNGPVSGPIPRTDRTTNRNPFRLYHMSGNVREWTATSWHTGDEGLAEEEYKVVRGGSFASRPELLKSAARERVKATQADIYTGFRVVREIL